MLSAPQGLRPATHCMQRGWWEGVTTVNVLLPRLSPGSVLQEKCISTQYTEACLFCSITRLIEFPVLHQNGNFAVMVQSCKKKIAWSMHYRKCVTQKCWIIFTRVQLLYSLSVSTGLYFFLINKLYVNSDFIRPFSFMYILFYQGCNAWSVLHCKSRYGIDAIMAFYYYLLCIMSQMQFDIFSEESQEETNKSSYTSIFMVFNTLHTNC